MIKCDRLKIEVEVMHDFLEFLTSKEIIIVYVISGIACLLCVVIYYVEKNNDKRRKKHNTRELNKLVSEVREEIEVVDESVSYKEPVIYGTFDDTIESPSVSEMLDNTLEFDRVEINSVNDDSLVLSQVDNNDSIFESVAVEEKVFETADVLEYTTIEPDQATAQMELKKLTEELRKQEEMKAEIIEENNDIENISLTDYEEQQEENAIISLEELVRKSKEMYEVNELTQYADEGNEPITLQELERHVGKKSSVDVADEPFVIENVISKDEIEVVEEKSVVSDSSVQTTVNTSSTKKFKNSPIISPIYGIEKVVSDCELELENTANYDKLDQEIRKTNEFLLTLKELQKKLE